MAEIMFYRLLLDHEKLLNFLIENNLILGPNSGNQDSIMFRDRSCRYPSTGFTFTFRKRNLKSPIEERLGLQGQNTLSLPTLRCKSCKTYLSPSTGGFLSYMDRTRRANCKLSPEKILKIIFHWANQSSVKLSKILLDVSDYIIVDWFNHCREVFRRRNIQHFNNHKLGDGNGQRINGQPSEVMVHIDETLLCGKRRANVGRLLAADQTIPEEEIQEWEELNKMAS
ncbi:hypothetical protein RF11_15662 [Thelohanellus kitauei]|uniref:Uncharacterized protein n=1 Tax=Thelohanellus kitauei TaxID=669202 RepID=A0A0C2N0I2_THEKT|nr:hypothetical protein RF11_15662 [Thelohanellus kitauei]